MRPFKFCRYFKIVLFQISMLMVIVGVYPEQGTQGNAPLSLPSQVLAKTFSKEVGLDFCMRSQGWLTVSPYFLHYLHSVLNKNEDLTLEEVHLLEDFFAKGYAHAFQALLPELNAKGKARIYTYLRRTPLEKRCAIVCSKHEVDKMLLVLGQSSHDRVMKACFGQKQCLSVSKPTSSEVKSACDCALLNQNCHKISWKERLMQQEQARKHHYYLTKMLSKDKKVALLLGHLE